MDRNLFRLKAALSARLEPLLQTHTQCCRGLKPEG